MISLILNQKTFGLKSRVAHLPTPQSHSLIGIFQFAKDYAQSRRKKRTLFFYYWAKDEKLFFIEYDRKVFDGFQTEVPHKHPDNQLHYKIPKSEWTEIEWEAKVEE